MSAAPTNDQIRLDATSLRGVAHPVRLRILGLLRTEGPATASDMARRLDLNTGATSYHLRKLAEHGFVVDDPVRGAHRERRWRAAHADTAVSDDARRASEGVGEIYLRALATLWSDDMFRAVDASAALPTPWRSAQDFSDYGLRLTPTEAKDLIRQVHAVVKNVAKNRRSEPLPRPGAARYTVQIQIFPHLDYEPAETTTIRTQW